MNEVKENASDIEYVVEGVVHNFFANNPVAKDDQNTVKIQNLAKAALGQGFSMSVCLQPRNKDGTRHLATR